MSDLAKFQEEHGEQWNAITQSPSFSAAMSYLNLAKIQEITLLTDENIESYGKLILADLRGHLKHEHDLYTLAVKPNLDFNSVIPETYPNPIDEIEFGEHHQDNSSPPKPPRKRRK